MMASNSDGPLVNVLKNKNMYGQIHQTIVNRLKQQQLQFDSTKVLENIQHILPTDNYMNVSTREYLQQIIGNHLSINDTNLQSALQLIHSNSISTADVSIDTQYYYVRSWTLLPQVIKEVIAYWEEEQVHPEIKDVFLEYLDENQGASIHVRYIGTCCHPATPYSCRQYDKELDNILGEFLRALRKVSPSGFVSGQIYEFQNARLLPQINQSVRDLQKSILIAIFQQKLLLNQQHGGYFASYQPRDSDRQLFSNLHTKFFNNFLGRATAMSTVTETGLRDWINTIDSYAKNNDHLTMTNRYLLNSEALKTIHEQAQPKTINGHTILVLIGDVPPISYFWDQGRSYPSFFSGVTRAGYLARDFLSRLQAFEQGKTSWNHEDLAIDPFPYVNLYPWREKEGTFVGATDQLRQYFSVVNPIIAVTFSRNVSKVALANFYSQNGITNTQFNEFIGIPALQTFASTSWLHDDEQKTPPPGSLIIIIPHYHPGRDEYDQQFPSMRRLMDICWMITIFIAEYAMNLATSTNQDHDAICHNIIDHCHPNSNDLDPCLADLYCHLAVIKTEFLYAYRNALQYRRAARIILPTATRQKYAHETMKQHGQAKGDPNSTDRQRQVNYLWKKNDRCLHIHIGRNEEERWREWGMNLSNGTHFLASAMNLAVHNIPNRHRLAHILNQFAPPDATKDDWMNDDELRNEALSSWGKQAALGRIGLSLHGEERKRYISQQQRRRAVGDDARLYIYDYQSIMEGRDVTVRKNGELMLRRIDPNGEQVEITMRISLHVVELLGSHRLRVQLRFLEDGIGLQHGQQFFQAPGLTAEQGVLPRKRFFTQENGFRLDELWRFERNRIMGIDEPMDIVKDVTERGIKRGRDMFRSGTSERTIMKFGKIKEGDQVWPLLQWLREFGGDGVVTTAPPAYQDREGHPQLSVDFLEYLNEYHVNHPYYHAWLTALGDIKLNGKHIIKNIKYIRTNVQTHEIQVRNNPTLKSYRRIQFGPESEEI